MDATIFADELAQKESLWLNNVANSDFQYNACGIMRKCFIYYLELNIELFTVFLLFFLIEMHFTFLKLFRASFSDSFSIITIYTLFMKRHMHPLCSSFQSVLCFRPFLTLSYSHSRTEGGES